MRPGFTLIELLIVVAITAVMTTLVVAQFRTQDKQRSVEQAATQIIDGLKQIQTMALSGTVVGTTVPDTFIYRLSCSPECRQTIIGMTDSSETILSESTFSDGIIVTPTMVEVRALPPRGALMDQSGITDGQIIVSHQDGPVVVPVCVGLEVISGRISRGCH